MKERIDISNLPQHIAVIMDGNGRWAKERGAERVFGHRSAIQAVRDAAEGCAELGIGYLTLYAFSTENWGRPQAEVNALMQLLVATIKDEIDTLMKNNIRLSSIGDISGLPPKCYRELKNAMATTSDNNGLTLTLALNYSGRWEITEAVKSLAREVKAGLIDVEDIAQETIGKYLRTYGMPDPELLIRTSGEMRVSNFLLWQIAYTELYVTKVLWPDFRREHLYEAILSYQQRERRFGKISEKART